MKMALREAWSLLKAAAADWVDDGAPRLGAALAYYTLFSMAPLLVIAIGIAGMAFGAEAAQGRVVAELQGLMGTAGAEAAQALIQNTRRPETGIPATLVALATLFLGASGVFVELKSALDVVWETQSRGGFVATIRTRLAAFALVLAAGFLLVVSLLVSAALSALGPFLEAIPGLPAFLLQALNAGLSLAVLTLLFALLFKFLPDVRVAWRDVWAGAFLTAGLFTAGKHLIGLYLGRASLASTYGAAASVVVLMVWVYYAAQVFFLGAELTQACARRRSPRV
jgi:membrane protein